MAGYEGKTVRLQPPCLRCGGRMREGFIPDLAYGALDVRRSMWIEGAPEERSFGALKVTDAPGYWITTFRCEHCGWLDSFALPEREQ